MACSTRSVRNGRLISPTILPLRQNGANRPANTTVVRSDGPHSLGRAVPDRGHLSRGLAMRCTKMKKTIALVAAGLVALVVLARATNVTSYATTLWSQAKTAVKEQVPTKFDIERIRHEIA